jgi:hypothetical protein
MTFFLNGLHDTHQSHSQTVKAHAAVDNVTADTQPGFEIPDPGALVPNLYIDGVRVSAQYNAKEAVLTPDVPLSEGKHLVSYSLTNVVGEESVASSVMSIVIDRQAVEPLVDASLAAVFDMVAYDGEILTVDARPDFAITAVDDDTPNLYVDGVRVSSSYNARAATLTPTHSLPDGRHFVSYSLTDSAGNESPLSAPLAIIVDNSRVQESDDALNATSENHMFNNADNLTADTTPDFAIAPVDNYRPNLYVDGMKVPAIYNADSSVLTPQTPLLEGLHHIAYSLTDLAGNETAPSEPLPILIYAALEKVTFLENNDMVVGNDDLSATLAMRGLLGSDASIAMHNAA